MNEHLKDSADSLRSVRDGLNSELKKAAENSEDVKSGLSTPEEEMQEPGNVLFNAISEISIKILEDPAVSEQFIVLAKELSAEAVKALINAMAIAMTYSAYHSIAFYDDLLKKELEKQFQNIGHHINLGKADMEGYESVIKVLKTKIGEISEKLQIIELKNKINENQ